MTDEPETPADIDTLMAIDPMDLSKQDLDKIIAYQRRMRQQRSEGVRTRKPKDEPAAKLNVDALLTKPIGAPVQRRF